MKKIVLTFGLISGVVSAVLMFSTIPFVDRIGYDNATYFGYTSIVMSFLFVFFGIRSYRENIGNGAISFGRALSVGILITLISCAFYATSWQIISYTFMSDFLDKYSAYVVEHAKASGESAAAIEAKRQELEYFKKLYANPFLRWLMTFLVEPLPVGLLVTLVSSVILRKKPRLSASGEPVGNVETRAATST
jgi:hypothetical protein